MQSMGISQEKLSRSLGVTRGAVGHYLSGRRSPNLGQLERIADTLQVQPAWLLFGKSVSEIREHSLAYSVAQGEINKIPIVGTSLSGPTDAIQAYINLPRPTSNSYALSIVGSNYSPRIYEQEAILIDPDIEPSSGDDVVIKHKKTNAVKLYDLVKIRGRKITLNNLAGKQERLVVDITDIVYIHCIVAIIRVSAIE